MAVHRRQLPLAYHCEGFVPAPGSSGDGGHCERCCRDVHDVSAMREPQLRHLLAAHAGGTVCLAYRVDARGWVRLLPEPTRAQRPSLVVGALALLLAACAGHASELEIPGERCRDADGYEVACDEWSAPMWSAPAAEPIDAREPGGNGCPIRPTAPLPASDGSGGVETAAASRHEGSDLVPAPQASDAAPEADPTSTRARADFSVDPDRPFVRGIIVVGCDGWIERDFVPTAELWEQWGEQSRARRAERKRARQRWRAARVAKASR